MTRDGQRRRSDATDADGHRRQAVEATDGNPLGLPDPLPPTPQQPWRWLGFFAFSLLSMAMLATAIVASAAGERKTSLLQAEERRLEDSVLGRAKVLRTWLDGRLAASRRLTESHVFRLFVADLARHDPKLPLPRSLQDQRPYFRQLMADFAKQNDLVRATVLRDDGTVLLSSPGPALAIAGLKERLDHAPSAGKAALSPIRRLDDGHGTVAVDAIMTFPKAQSEGLPPGEPSSLLVLTLPIGDILHEILADRITAPDAEHVELLQERDAGIDRLRAAPDGIALGEAAPPDGYRPGMPLAFGRRSDEKPIYSLAAPVEGVGWTLHHAVDARAVLAPVHDFIKVAAGLSAMAVLLLTAAFSALWWRQGRGHYRRLAAFHQAHASDVDRQRQFLRSVTTSIGDWLIVSAPDGRLIYTNPAFDALFDRSKAPVSEADLEELRPDSCPAGQIEDDLADLVDADGFDLLDIGGSRRIVATCIADLRSADGGVAGRVRIVRDHTGLVTERRRRLRSLARTVDAFVHAIELRDPFLLGHTRRLRAHAIAIGRQLGLAHDDLAALALAASLSQIGKIFIADDVLAKPDRHDADEEHIMRDHILHAIDILERLDFDLPVVDMLAQMHERLDGSGYPHGLRGDQVGPGGRILAVADVFCARTAPRSYRDRLSAGKTLYHLARNDRRYDVKVVAALADIVARSGSLEGGDLADPAFIDAAVWREREPGLRSHRELSAAIGREP